jgi:hypothetical protein
MVEYITARISDFLPTFRRVEYIRTTMMKFIKNDIYKVKIHNPILDLRYKASALQPLFNKFGKAYVNLPVKSKKGETLPPSLHEGFKSFFDLYPFDYMKILYFISHIGNGKLRGDFRGIRNGDSIIKISVASNDEQLYEEFTTLLLYSIVSGLSTFKKFYNILVLYLPSLGYYYTITVDINEIMLNIDTSCIWEYL